MPIKNNKNGVVFSNKSYHVEHLQAFLLKYL